MRCAVIVVDGCFGSAVASLIDVLRTAEVFRAQIDHSIPSFEVSTLSTGSTVSTSAGWAIPIDEPIEAVGDFETIVVPALGALTADDVVAALASDQVKQTVDAVASCTVGTVAGACTGTFPLAEAGLLDGRKATTSWWLGSEFRSRYREVDLQMDRMVVVDGPFLTAGAAFAHIDLALALVASQSPELADLVARVLVVDERPDQGSYVALEVLTRDDALVQAFEELVRANLEDEFTVSDIARQLGVSTRTLQRRVTEAVGMSPLSFIQRIRVERARHLRRTTDLSFERIAREVGYQNASTLHRLLRSAGRAAEAR